MPHILVLGEEEAPRRYLLERVPNTDRYLLCEVTMGLDNRAVVAGPTYILDNRSVLSVSDLYKLLNYDENLAHLTIQAALEIGHLERTQLAHEGADTKRERWAEDALYRNAAYDFVNDAVFAVNKVARKLEGSWEDNNAIEDFLGRYMRDTSEA